MGIRESLGGSVTFAQRFGSALNLNPHFHSLLLDSEFNKNTGVFHPAPSLKDEDVKEIVETTAHRVIRMLKRRGVLDENEYDEFAEEQPVLAGMTSASIIGLVSIGERAGQRVRRVLQDPAEAVKTGHLCFSSRGFSLHAATRIAENNKKRAGKLMQLCGPSAVGSRKSATDFG
jgi:hypothetical protein